MILMALSNKFGHLVLSTGNKSELAVGYCTLYGDMAGGLAVISDVPKTIIYELARWINSDYAQRAIEVNRPYLAGKGRGGSPEPPRGEIIPKSTIEKPPSAELKPNQKDQDTLPPYEVLDQILQLYVEDNLSARDIISHGFDEKTVRWVQRRVDLNEYKREQAAPWTKSHQPRLRHRPQNAHRAEVRRLRSRFARRAEKPARKERSVLPPRNYCRRLESPAPHLRRKVVARGGFRRTSSSHKVAPEQFHAAP